MAAMSKKRRTRRTDPMKREKVVKRVKVDGYVPAATREANPLTPDQVGALLEAASTKSASGLRLRALLAVWYGAGLRLNESLTLLPRDLRLAAEERPEDESTIHVRNPKGRDRKKKSGSKASNTCAMLPELVPHVRAWLNKRREYGLGDDDPVFATISKGKCGAPTSSKGKVTIVPGRVLYQSQVTASLRRLQDKAIDAGAKSLEGFRVRPHDFRHGHATTLIRNRWTVDRVSRQLRHSSIQTTFVYLHRIGATDNGELMARTSFGVVDDAAPAGGRVVNTTLHAKLPTDPAGVVPATDARLDAMVRAMKAAGATPVEIGQAVAAYHAAARQSGV